MCLYRHTDWECGHFKEAKTISACEEFRRGLACEDEDEEPVETWPEKCPGCIVRGRAVAAAVAAFAAGKNRQEALEAALDVIEDERTGDDGILGEIEAMDLSESFIETWRETLGGGGGGDGSGVQSQGRPSQPSPGRGDNDPDGGQSLGRGAGGPKYDDKS